MYLAGANETTLSVRLQVLAARCLVCRHAVSCQMPESEEVTGASIHSINNGNVLIIAGIMSLEYVSF